MTTNPAHTPDPTAPVEPAELDQAMVEAAAREWHENDPTEPRAWDALADDERGWYVETTRKSLAAAGVPGLVAEVERLRYDLDHSYSQREWSALTARATSAEQERDRLRAGIRSVPSTPSDVHGLRGRQAAAYRAGWEAAGRAYRALLAGSGEQPGCECYDTGGNYGVCDEHAEDARHPESYRAGLWVDPAPVVPDECPSCGSGSHWRVDAMCRPAPVVPDSPDERERVRDAIEDGLCLLGSNFLPDDSERIVVATENGLRNATDAVLAVVGQGVTAERAWDEGYAAGLRDAPRGEPGGTPNPRRAAVRPTGQEQADG